MATSFEVIFLGTAADIDINEGNAVAGNASSLVGTTYGAANSPLYAQVHNFSAVNYSGGDATVYDTDNNLTNDTFSIDGGPAQIFDSVVSYQATVTYIDGTTGTISAVIMQDTAGRLYLMPEMTNNADVAVLNAAPIRSMTFNSLLVNDSNMAADRFDMHFMNPVDGTSGNDSMGVGYTDGDGD
ncbi:hypothetical protein [Thioclava sp. GXIMD2076]|uniref:hypothetical protein n=1 Tax=Thioclava sp. GXIMD2076 TaxID=3131931 RepID=UPI0030D5FF30